MRGPCGKLDRPRARGAVLVAFLLGAWLVAAAAPERGRALAEEGYLTGQLLVASPTMTDPRFAQTVIYMVRHDATGAMGLVLNRLLGVGPVSALLKEFGIEGEDGTQKIRLHYGGPVQESFGFVIHSTDFNSEDTLIVEGGIAVSANLEVLRAIAAGKGPERRFVALGYAGWGAGQLESELALQAWVSVPPDEKLVFDDAIDSKWDRAMAKLGVDL